MLRWMDGFDHYGNDATLMQDGSYAAASVTLRTDRPRSGTHQCRITAGDDGGLRRVFGDDLEEVGVGYAFYIPTLPTNSGSLCLAEFRDNANIAQFGICVTSTGQVFCYRGGGENGPQFGAILDTSGVCVVAQSYQHFEVRGLCDDAVGAVEVRLNGVTVLNLTGANTKAARAADAIIAQVFVGAAGEAVIGFPGYVDMDDFFCWDTLSGSENNDFVGDKKVYTVFPDADTATEDWTPSVGSDSFEMLNNSPPIDDTDYLVTDDVGARTIVGLQDLPEGIVAIAGVMFATRTWKTDAGNSKVQVGSISAGSETDGVIHAVSMAPTYYTDVFEHDPNTSALWTVAGFNASQALVERTE